MRRLLLLCLAVLALPFALGGQGAGHVVLVSIDGFAAYHLKNPELDLPNIRALARAGVEAASSETVFPSVTHPSHTTMVTGVTPRRHGVLSNRLVDRRTGRRFHVTNERRTDIVTAPTLFDAAKKKGLTTAAFFWPETKEDPSIDFNVPEVFAAENVADIDAVSPAILKELRDAGVPIDDYFRFYHEPYLHGAADVALAKAAAHAIRTDRPHLLAIHFLMTDIVQHEVGPAHYRSKQALSSADHALGFVLKAIEEAGLKDDTTVIVGADHGFATIEWQVNVAPAFAALGDRVALHAGGWSLFVERLPAFDAAKDGPLLEKAYATLAGTPGVSRVVRGTEFHALGLPTYDESPYVRGHDFVLADIDTFLTAGDTKGPMTRTRMAEPRHEHGYLPGHPKMHTSLVLSGRGIRRGATIGHVRNLDIAPTIAHLLGLEMPPMEGKVMAEALAPAAR